MIRPGVYDNGYLVYDKDTADKHESYCFDKDGDSVYDEEDTDSHTFDIIDDCCVTVNRIVTYDHIACAEYPEGDNAVHDRMDIRSVLMARN